jgi:hypothetical protein
VKSLNGCFKFHIKTIFQWDDTSECKQIKSTSKLFVRVDPPHPFSSIPKPILEKTGFLAMNTAVSIIEKEFVNSLAKDFARWSSDRNYRDARAARGPAPVSI